MISTANIATYPPRRDSLIKMLKSVVDQFDLIRVCCNGYDLHHIDALPQFHNVTYHKMKGDKADNAKFYWLDLIEKPEIFHLLDDDIEYPQYYRQATDLAVKEFGCIVSYHGRVIPGLGHNYYHGTLQYHFANDLAYSRAVHVGGTGCMAFSTEYFHPKGLADAQDLRMADLLLSLEAAKQGKQIGVLGHQANWLKPIKGNKETIFELHKDNCKRQNELADEIFKIKPEL